MLRTEKFLATFWRPSDMGGKIQTFQASLLERIYIQPLNKSTPKIALHLHGRLQDCRFVYDELNHQINLNVFFLQERLIKKLGAHAFPFYFELPPHCPASVTLQPAPGDTGKPCGVDYELKAFVGESQDDKPHKRNSVR